MLPGRREQSERLAAFLDGAVAGSDSILHIVGEPGIGKTTLVDAVLADFTGLRTIRVVGVQTERTLSLAALVSVARAVSGTFDDLAPRSATVLRALLDAGDAQTPMAISNATLQLLGTVAEHQPTVIVVDDAQWVDPESLAALVFAARRLQADPFGLIVVSRDDARLELPAVDQLRLEGLDAGASADVLLAAAVIVPSVLSACTDRCAGNPLALRLLAEALTPAQRQGLEELPAHLPLPDALSAALRSRLDVLPLPTRRALLLVALGGSLTDDQLSDGLVSLGLELADLDSAVAHGVVSADGRRITFTHPLLAEAARVAHQKDLRAAHVALALATDGDRRAWHLVDSGTLSTSQTLAELDALVSRATARNAYADMAHAATEAARRTASAEQRARRLLTAGQGWRATASYSKSIGVLREALATTEDPGLAAQISEVLADAVGFETSVPEAIRLLIDAANPVLDDDPARAATLLALASQFATLAAEPERAVALGERAESVAASADDITRLAVRVLSTHALLNRGRPVDDARLADLDLIASATVAGAPIEVVSLAQVVGFDYFTIERWDAADALFGTVIAAAKQASYVGVHVFACAMRGEVLWRLGRWSEARTEANADVEHHLRLDHVQGGFGHATVARVAAATGSTGEAVSAGRLAVEHGDRIGMDSLSAWGRHALGLAALADGRPDEAVQHLDWIWRLSRRAGVDNPGILWWQGDLFEAFVQIGALDDAHRMLTWMESVGSPYGTQWPLAIIDRGRAILHGDLGAARSSVQRLTTVRAPFEAARSRLVVASLSDGDERRDEAERALDTFEALGAMRWEREARAILGAARRLARPALSTVLTPAELRVALVVGEGLTNRQAASALALSPKTIDAHLQSIYRKIGLRSRTELAVAVSREHRAAIGDRRTPPTLPIG